VRGRLGLALVAVLAFTAVAVALAFAAQQDPPARAYGEPQRGSASGVSAWRALRPAQLERTEVTAARIGRFVYVVGGFERKGSATTDAVERYDLRRNRWRDVRSMPVGVNHSAAASYRGNLYVFGGYTGRNDLSDETAALHRYDPGRNRWSQLPSAPEPRGAHAVEVIGNRLYAVGGVSGGQTLKSLLVYDFKKRRWSRGPDMRTAREHLAATVAGGQLYVLAGRAGGQGNFAVAERYDPRSRRWTDLPEMAKPRGGIAAATVGDRVVVFGGEEGAGTIREVEIFDPNRDRWSRLPDMRTPRHGLGGVSFGRRVYAVEGGPTPGFDFSNAIEALEVPR